MEPNQEFPSSTTYLFQPEPPNQTPSTPSASGATFIRMETLSHPLAGGGDAQTPRAPQTNKVPVQKSLSLGFSTPTEVDEDGVGVGEGGDVRWTGTGNGAGPQVCVINPTFSMGPMKLPPKSSLKKGHSRSASHGGVMVPHDPLTSNPTHIPTLPSALSKKGHARAASHGQIVEDQNPLQNNLKGHSRTQSKTDFILPPGHLERTAQPPLVNVHVTSKGHSRQASRSESIYTLRADKKVKSPWFFWRRSPGEDPKTRIILPNHVLDSKAPGEPHPNAKYPTNQIRTTKYTAISFLPKNLFEQFHRFANLYFISIVLLNWIPAINAFGKEIAMLPVMFVMGVTAIKDLFEDRRRHKSDNRINNSFCRLYNK